MTTGDLCGFKHIDPRIEDERFGPFYKRRVEALCQKFFSLFSCDDRSPFDAYSFNHKKEISRSCSARFNQILFFDLADHMAGENDSVQSGCDFGVTSDEGDLKAMGGIVDLAEGLINDLLIRSFFRKEEGGQKVFWSSSSGGNIIDIDHDPVISDLLSCEGK